MTRRPALRAALALALVLDLAGCASLNNPFDRERPRQASDVPEALELARAKVAEGDTERALELLGWAREVRGLSPERRGEVEALLDAIAEQRMAEIGADPEGAKELARMVELGLPNQLAVAAGVRAARLYLEDGRPHKAYSLLKDLEEKYPRHHGKVEAGAVLAEAGLMQIQDEPGFMGFFTKRDDGIEILEYLVLTYPADPRCAEGYRALAQAYEEDRRWSLARERHEDLRLWHADSPYAIESEAMIPRLRLRGLGSPEYERRELLKARFELETWLARHAGHELEPKVQEDLADCRTRLARNDLGVARFYERIEQYNGARYHAERARADAHAAGFVRLDREAEQLLARLPDDSRSKAPGAGAFSADDSLIRTSLEQLEEEAAEEPATEEREP
jgi:hypothetical protein